MRALSEWALFDPKQPPASVSNGAAYFAPARARCRSLRKHSAATLAARRGAEFLPPSPY
jgi:hypothetical protein